jgi:nucleotide-binding universal stress UspA family protein
LSTLDRILVPVDFSEPSREALLHAYEVANLFDATVDVLHVVQQTMHPAFYVGGITDIRDIDPNIEEKVKARVTEFIAETLRIPETAGGPSDSPPDTERVVPHMIMGAVDMEVPKFIEEHGTDLVVMSTKGQTGLDRVLLGSVAEKIVRIAPCPVLTVKAGAHSLVT